LEEKGFVVDQPHQWKLPWVHQPTAV
jgi:hypothetical protein